MKKKTLFLILFTMVSVLVLSACGKGTAPQFPAPLVEVMSVHKFDVPISFDYAARIVPFKETQVRARVGGVLLHRYFREGSYVKKGDILFEIDPQAYELNVIRAQAQVAQAKVAYEKAKADAERADKLVKQNVQAPAFKEEALAEKLVKEALWRQAEAELSTAELNLNYTKVTAPISGITSREVMPEGSLIAAGTESSLLTTVTQIDPVYVNFSYSDADAKQIKKYLEQIANRTDRSKNTPKKLHIAIFLGDDSLYPETGVIDFTAPSLDSSTGTISARAVVQNADHSLIPGQFVRVRVLGLKSANSIAIPEGALMQDGLGSYVFVLEQMPNPQAKTNPTLPATINLVKRRDVKVVRQLANRDWLLQDAVVTQMGDENSDQKLSEKLVGLKEGEKIVTKGHIKIQGALTAMGDKAAHGMPVQISHEWQQILKEDALPITKATINLDDKQKAKKTKRRVKKETAKESTKITIEDSVPYVTTPEKTE